MGVKFRQSRETIHIAIEIVDRYYLKLSQGMIAKTYKAQLMHPCAVILHQVTALLISSKFDEIDDNITAIRDLRDYVHKQVSQQQRSDLSLVPSFTQIVECERKLLQFFKWDLKFVLPLHMVRAFMANGVIFTNEFADVERVKSAAEVLKIKAEWSRAITTESLSISDLIVSKGNVSYRSQSSSNVAASIIYLARKNILEADSPSGQPRVPNIWPQELVMMTRCTESKAKRILVDVLRPFDQTRKEESQALKILSQKQNVVNIVLKPSRPPKYASGNLISADKVLEKKAVSKPTGRILSHQRMQQYTSSESPTNNLLTGGGQNEDTEISLRDKTYNPHIQNMLAMPARYHAQSIKEMVKSSEGLKINEDTIQERHGVSFAEIPNTFQGSIAKAHSQRQILLPNSSINFQSTDSHDQQTRLLSRQLADINSKQDSTQVQSPQEEKEGDMKNTKQFLALPNITTKNTNFASAYQSIEKIIEASHEMSDKTVSVGATTAFKSHCNGELGKSMLRPKESIFNSTQNPFSSSKRPKNELGFRDQNDTEKREGETSLNASNPEPIQTLPTEIKKLKKQPSVQTRKPLTKTKYVEVKRAQLAKIDSARSINNKPVEKKKSQNKLILTGDNQVVSPVEAQRMIPQYPGTAKHSSNPKINSFEKNGGQIEKDSNGFRKQGGNQISNKAAPRPAPMSSQKQLCNLSCQSNEYFSVLPKMIDHVNQMAIQKEILRSGSIEYEVNQQLLDKSGGYKTGLSPSEYNKQATFRRTAVFVHGQNGNSVPATNLQGSSQVSFFKRQLADNFNGLTQPINQNDRNQRTQNIGDLHELDSSNQELQHTIGSGINHSSARAKNSRKTTHHKLPLIDGATNSNQMNYDFSQAIEPFIKPSSNLNGTQQLKYLTKTNSAIQTALIRKEGSTQEIKHKAQSMRDLQTSQDEKQALQSLKGATKTKNSIFGAQNTSANTKSINGFGPHQGSQPHPLNMNAKVYSINAIRKGPSFSQIHQIITPTSILESTSRTNVGIIHGNRIISNSEPQDRSLANQKLNSGQHSTSMSNFYNNLISAQQSGRLNRNSPKKEQPLNPSSQLSSSVQRYISGAAGSNTLMQIQADEAIANLKHHNSMQRGLVDKPGSVAKRAQPQQLPGEQKHQSPLKSHRQIAPPVGQRNQAQGLLSATNKLSGQNSQSKILSMESNRQSTYISNRESSAKKIKNLNQGVRSQETLNSALRTTTSYVMPPKDSVSHLRLRQFKSHVSQQDSKH